MSSLSKEQIYFNAFNQISQIGPVRFGTLLNYFPNLETAWQASPHEFKQAGLEESVIEKILELRTKIDPEALYQKLLNQQIKLLTYFDEGYPKLLKEIASPPMILYIRGELLPQDDLAVAIVGSRKFSSYGQQVTRELTRDLVRANLTIVSGLALGIDALAHETAVYHSGRTLAVLACGLDLVYPASNRLLAEKILENHGAILTELPLGTPPLKHHFPNRNRLISGLGLGTIVIEAALESGALITARHALEQNRQVFAVPGPIYNPTSAGPNNLLKLGAKPVTLASDILEELNLGHLQEQISTTEVMGDNLEEQKILDCLSREPLHFNQITKLVGLSSSVVAATLTILEMKGKVRNLGANQYVKSR